MFRKQRAVRKKFHTSLEHLINNKNETIDQLKKEIEKYNNILEKDVLSDNKEVKSLQEELDVAQKEDTLYNIATESYKIEIASHNQYVHLTQSKMKDLYDAIAESGKHLAVFNEEYTTLFQKAAVYIIFI